MTFPTVDTVVNKLGQGLFVAFVKPAPMYDFWNHIPVDVGVGVGVPVGVGVDPLPEFNVHVP